jgi:hypothetical protein
MRIKDTDSIPVAAVSSLVHMPMESCRLIWAEMLTFVVAPWYDNRSGTGSNSRALAAARN